MSLLVFFIGAIFGSFYLVVATRLPQNEDILVSRSHCDHCQVTLKWYQLIPLFSYVIFNKCPNCHERVPIINFIIELVTGLLFLFMYSYFGISYEFFMGLIISSLLILIFISDFKYLIILDSPLVISTILGLILKYIYFGISECLISLLGGILLFGLMLLLGIFGTKVFKKEALGGGDIKFAFVMGLILGFPLGLTAVFLSAFLALPISLASVLITKNNEVPYGPFLVGSLFIVFVFLEKFNNLLFVIFNL